MLPNLELKIGEQFEIVFVHWEKSKRVWLVFLPRTSTWLSLVCPPNMPPADTFIRYIATVDQPSLNFVRLHLTRVEPYPLEVPQLILQEFEK